MLELQNDLFGTKYGKQDLAGTKFGLNYLRFDCK